MYNHASIYLSPLITFETVADFNETWHQSPNFAFLLSLVIVRPYKSKRLRKFRLIIKVHF
jgi:hypothetical protein